MYGERRTREPTQTTVTIIPIRSECNTVLKTNMASCMGMVLRALTVLKPAATHCSRQRTSVFIPRRFSHGARSSLYEHVREGYSDKPELDMRGVCEETDKVIANVENRKGDLRGDDVRKIVCVSFNVNSVLFVTQSFILCLKDVSGVDRWLCDC